MVKAGERSRLITVVWEVGAWLPGWDVLLTEEGPNVFLSKFPFPLALSMDEGGRSSHQFWYCSLFAILLILESQYWRPT